MTVKLYIWHFFMEDHHGWITDNRIIVTLFTKKLDKKLRVHLQSEYVASRLVRNSAQPVNYELVLYYVLGFLCFLCYSMVFDSVFLINRVILFRF